MHDAVRLKQCIDVAGSPAGIVGESHRGTAEHVEVRDHAPPGEAVAEAAERIFDARPVE